MDKKKLKIIVLICIGIIIAIVLLSIKLINIRKNGDNVEVANEDIELENEIDNNIIENEIVDANELEENVEENEEVIEEGSIPNKVESTPVADSEQEIDKQTIQKQETSQEKAINIAKKDWGEDSKVYFSLESTDYNGKYWVCVRETSTTHTLRTYVIDVNKGTFKIEE